MISIKVVEPYALIRLGIQQLLQKIAYDVSSEGLDYHQLFQNRSKSQPTDLMLLSVPDTYDRTLELINAAQISYEPQRILLLSETHTLPYSLLNMPANLAGYISKHSSHEVLASAVTLVLAGGKCFPAPDGTQTVADTSDRADPPSGRRWYDQRQPLEPITEESQTASLLPPARAPQSAPAHAIRPTPQLLEDQAAEQPLSAEMVGQEARLLNLTPRQYEVLVLLARGHPLKTVSRELDISLATAKTHTEALYQRLSVNNRNAAVYAALSKGATLGWYDADLKDPEKLKRFEL